MLSLILRLLVARGGRILVDGRPIENIAETSLRALITGVPQTPLLLSGTVADNLRLADPDATDEELRRALARAALGDWLSARPRGLDTPVGIGGGQLSVGERQRVAIARAFLRRAPILVLDEATSALDPHAESEINRQILAESRRRTIVSVTHRLSSVTAFDRIFVFDRGRLVDEGCHDQLLSRAGVYQLLWEKQHGFEVDDEHATVSVTPARLRAVPFLAAAGEQTLERFADAFVYERFSEGAAICAQGEPGDKFYILMRGTVDVELADQTGQTRLLGRLMDGDYFGEIALLEDRPRTATIRARTHCQCLALPRRSFIMGLRDDPALAASIGKAIHDRLEEQRESAR
jgi:ATP-binding cassette subfamily B protein